MNNQWGRSGSGPAGGSGMGGILFASVVCLALGAAGGYGAFRMMDGPVPQGEIEARDKRIADLARELDARTAQVEENARKAEALGAQNGTLRQQVEALRKDAGGPDVAAITAERNRLLQEVVPELENQVELLGQRAADAEALKKKAEEAVRDRERRLSLQGDRIAGLQKTCTDEASARGLEADGLKAETVSLRAELEKALKAEEALRTRELPALKDEIARKDKEIAALSERAKGLTGQVEALEAASCMALPREPNENGRKTTQDADGASRDGARETATVPALNPRNVTRVAQAMRETPGLDTLTSAQRTQLEKSLVAGECVTNALGGVFRRIPVLAMRDLMRSLDSDC